MVGGTLGEYLVFDMDARHTGAFELLDGPHDVDRVAIAGAGIRPDRDIHRICHPAGHLHLLRHGQERLGGHQMGGRHPARHSDSFEAHPLQDSSHQWIVRSGNENGFASSDQITKLSTW